MSKRDGIVGLAIFAGLFLLLVLIDGNRLQLGTNDEGIYLSASQRMLQGQRVYTDFFGYMSPGAFWVQEWFFRVFGVTMLAGRMPVLFYFSAECALLYWLAARVAPRGAAGFAVLVFFAIQASSLSFLTAQHRWDSGAISLASIAVVVAAHDSGSKWLWPAAGALGALAAVFTPSMVLIPAATVLWLLLFGELRQRVVPYLAGAAAAGLAVLLLMASIGMIGPFIEQMRWLSRNYSTVNVMAYGATIGGYRNLMEGPSDASLLLRGLVVLCIALPAILPVMSLAGWAAFSLRSKPPRHIIYLLICSIALIASTYPRPDLMHLAWVAPVPFVLAAALLPRAVPKWAQAAVLIAGIFGAALLLLYLAGTLGGVRLATPVGEMRADKDSAAELQRLLDTVKPGDSAYVYPYKPLLYFLTQTRNPTRYSYMQPDMMDADDEQSSLADLRRAPPQWVLWLRLSPEEYLRVFPSADISKLHFVALESWMDANYAPVSPPVEVGGYALLRYTGSPRAAR